MASWLEKLFREHGVFKVPDSARRLPACRIRPLEDADVEACVRLYQLNEGGNFRGGLATFKESLDKGRSFYLVCEEEGEIRAMGGMNIRYNNNQEFVEFFYGMVHPDHQHRGFGTAIVFARLSVLPPPRDEWTIKMHSVADGFHRKFGFYPVEVIRDDEENRMTILLLYASATEITRARAALQAAGIPVECAGCRIPIYLHTPPAADPAPETRPLEVPPPYRPRSWASLEPNWAQAIFITTVAFMVVFTALFLMIYYKVGI